MSTDVQAAAAKATAAAVKRSKKTVGMRAAGGKIATGKPHRRKPGHKPVSRDQMEFMQAAQAEGTLVGSRVMGGAGARGGARGGGGASRDTGEVDDYAAIVRADAEAQLAADNQGGAAGARRGGRGYYATKGKHTQSDAALASLDLASADTVRELQGRIVVGHQNERQALHVALERNFPRWWQLLQSEFTLLLYGFGSKKALLDEFANNFLDDGGVCVINGFYPALTLKELLTHAAAAMTPESATERLTSLSNEKLLARIAAATCPQQHHQQQKREQLRQQQQATAAEGESAAAAAAAASAALAVALAPAHPAAAPRRTNPPRAHAPPVQPLRLSAPKAGPPAPPPDQPRLATCRRLYVVLHNIDGQNLRSPEVQAVLGELAAMPRVHLIASVDHINAPLLWTKREAARFNFVWEEATTYNPYAHETAHMPQSMASGGQERHHLRGAANVLQTLTPNSRHIFRLLAQHQLASPNAPGMPFYAFYTQVREQFLATTEATLRSHLTEFVDHKLTKTWRPKDGEVGELVRIPLADDVLRQLLTQF